MEEMKLSQIMELKEKSLSELKAKYKELFGQEPPSNNRVFLWRKIIYRVQELEFGTLSMEAQSKLQELIQKYDPVNNVLLRPKHNRLPAKATSPLTDRRLPIPGSIITKNYKGKKIQIKVLEEGFEYSGGIYRTLSSVAHAITGQHWNGYLFFGL